jgi:hypothetical protein
MKSYLIILIFFFLNVSVCAQVFNNTGTTGTAINYNISLPVAAEPWMIDVNSTDNTQAATGTKATAVFIEFGDGTFSFLPRGTHNFYTAFPNRSIITKTTGVYGGGGKPPAHSIESQISISESAPYVQMNNLPVLIQNGLAITPNIGSVLAKDTMIFVVTYKAQPKYNTLLFLFNDNINISAFKNIIVGQKIQDPNSLIKEPVLRTYSSETEVGIPGTGPVSVARGQNNQFANCLAINILNHDGNEHNIFITLIPKDGLLTTSLSETMVKAMLVGSAEGKGGNIDTISVVDTLPVVDAAHDPNYITVSPNCLLLPKVGKELQYHLHFQNTGPGRASKVKVNIKIPGPVNLSSEITYKSNYYKLNNGINNSLNPYSNSAGDGLEFVFVKKSSTSCTLEGMGTPPSPNCICNESTIGDLWFTIKTNNQMPDILLAQASIVFYNSDAAQNPNPPIITNTAVAQFRQCCDCNNSCDPCKNKKSFWKWLFCKKC